MKYVRGLIEIVKIKCVQEEGWLIYSNKESNVFQMQWFQRFLFFFFYIYLNQNTYFALYLLFNFFYRHV